MIVSLTGSPSSFVLVTLANPRKAPSPTIVMVPEELKDQVAGFVPSCGAIGVPQPSAGEPACQVSSQVRLPITFSNVPSALNIYSSSKKQALSII